MDKTHFTRFFKNAQITLTKHSPEILTGIGIAGMITTTILAVKATPKALKKIEEVKDVEGKDELTAAETVKATWKCYIPSAVTGVASIACLVGANSVHVRRNTALAAAYKLSETALTEYRDKVIETIGEKKEHLIRDEVNKDRMENHPVSKNQVIITERGNTLCLDTISKRYFKSDMEKIKRAVNELNRRMILDMYVSVNEFYDELGLDHTSVGDDLGWNIDHGFIDIYFGSAIADDGTPCIVLDYQVAPRWDFNKFG